MSTVPSIVQSDGKIGRSRAGVPALRLRFTPDTHLKVYHRVELDEGRALEVFGDGENGSYEWVLLDSKGPTKYSDTGYGQSSIALRDGLIEHHGLPALETHGVRP